MPVKGHKKDITITHYIIEAKKKNTEGILLTKQERGKFEMLSAREIFSYFYVISIKIC